MAPLFEGEPPSDRLARCPQGTQPARAARDPGTREVGGWVPHSLMEWGRRGAQARLREPAARRRVRAAHRARVA